ncbi:MAG: HAMP domain-containing sensor histidine kinase [Pseudomonadota bacterium]
MSPPARQPKLSTILTRRLIWIAGAVTIANLLFVAFFDASDKEALIADVVSRELNRLGAALVESGPQDHTIGDLVRSHYRDHPTAYAYAVVDSAGNISDGQNTEMVPDNIIESVKAAENWVARDRDQNSVEVLGSRLIETDDGDWRIYFVMREDPADLIGEEILDEFVGHVWLPLMPIAILLIGGTIFIIRRGLAPVADAAEWARSVKPGAPLPPFEHDSLPAEIGDLTDAAKRAVERLNDELAAEQRRAAEAAHALRTPVAVLVARLDSLPDDQAFGQFRADVNALSRTITQFLSSAGADRLEVGENDRADLEKIAEDTVAKLAPLAVVKGSEIVYSASGGPHQVRGSADAIALALTNLIENAIMHGGGSQIDVSVGPGAELTVRDHGKGLPEGTGQSLFHPFWRGAGAAPGGAGLGLAIVDRIQRAHGGSVHTFNAPDGGASFRLRYPTD